MNFQQKYLKYKSKYTQLKNQLKGGACNPVPVPTDREHISLDEYRNIPAARLETIGGHCYDIVELANWIHISANPTYPATGLPMSLNDIWNVITAYNAYRVADPAPPNHFIFTPAQSAQIIVALSNPLVPVPLAIKNFAVSKQGFISTGFLKTLATLKHLCNRLLPCASIISKRSPFEATNLTKSGNGTISKCVVNTFFPSASTAFMSTPFANKILNISREALFGAIE